MTPHPLLLEPARVKDQKIRRLVRLAWWLDNSVRIPLTKRRVGLDGLIGLVPVLGDAGGALASLWLIAGCARAGVPLSLLLRMLGHVAVSSLAGIVPLLGDLFDLSFKANARNATLLLRWHEDPATTARESRGALLAIAAVGFGIVATTVGIGAALGWWLGSLGGA